jgi:Tol biopolymer transport system component
MSGAPDTVAQSRLDSATMPSTRVLLVAALACCLAACGGGASPGASSASAPAPGASSASPGWSGDPQGVIVFVDLRKGNQEIFAKQLPNGDEIDLTNNPAEDFDPDISQDGAKIVFASNRSGSTQLWMMAADGSGVHQLTSDSQGGQSPRWSRDGKRIAYSRGGGDIAVMNADGSGIKVIMQAQDESAADPCRAGAFPGGWSPDDSRITYYSASVTHSVAQLCTLAADGSDIQVVVADPNSYDEEGVYSPDGTRIAYRAIINGQHDIWIVDLATGAKHNLTNDADVDIEPDWSPDGQWIAYGSLKAGQPNFDLYIMRPDGSDVRRITSDPAKEANPVWGP